MDNVRKIVPKITTEIPEPKRCCFCVPLRYGLLVWGYIKLALTVIIFLFGALILQMYTQLIAIAGYGLIPYIVAGMAILLLLMVDIGMTIAFLIGGHQKTTKLLRVFYIYSIVILVIDTLLVIIFASLREGRDSKNPRYARNYNNYVIYQTCEIVFEVAFFCVQLYIIILLRSEINKLTSRRNIRFSNITKEVECIGSTQNGNIESGSMYEQENENTKGNSFNYAKF